MSLRWDAELAPGSKATADDLAGAGIETRFDDQLNAEQWLTDNFAELADLGVASVTLFDEDEKVYGPMRLDEA